MVEKSQIDKIEGTDRNGVINLPIGHFSIVNNKFKINKVPPKLSIYGLGSCIALILCDFNSKICGMSHILLPRTTKKIMTYPHKYANLSAKLLVKELINHGAEREHIKAVVVGGSRIFNLDNNNMGFDNIGTTKEELKNLKIEIIKEDTGGSKGRIVIFDSKDFTLYIKTSGENDYKKFTYIK